MYAFAAVVIYVAVTSRYKINVETFVKNEEAEDRKTKCIFTSFSEEGKKFRFIY